MKRFIKILLVSVLVLSCDLEKKNEDFSNLDPLLSDYENGDIGKVEKRGYILVKDSLVIITASGNDIWGKKDSFHYLYKKVNGDFDAKVCIQSFKAVDLYSKFGLMMRNNLTKESSHSFFLMFADNSTRNNNLGGFEFQYRKANGGITKAIYPTKNNMENSALVEFPNMWIRLIRKGKKIESQFSYDNIVWITYSKIDLEMPKEMYLGVALTSHNNGKLSSVEFTDLEIN